MQFDAPTATTTAPEATSAAHPGLPRYLSPSSAGTFNQCARRWKLRYHDKLPDPPGEAALAGTFAHRVLELLFQLDAHERTKDTAKQLARQVWPDTERNADFVALGLDEAGARAFRWKGWQAIEGLWALEDPTDVTVAATEHDVVTALGAVPFRGIVDRLDLDDDGLTVTDYKSGKAPSARFSDDRLHQVLLYAAAVEMTEGERPVRARLLYLGQKAIEVAVTDDAVAPVLESLTDTWSRLGTSCSTQTFDPSPGPLCGWCPYVAHCAEGRAEVQRRHDLGVLSPNAPATPVTAGASVLAG